MQVLDFLKLKYLSEPRKALRFYLVLAFIDLLVFGFFGMHLAMAAYTEKKSEISLLESEVNELEKKKFSLIDMDAELSRLSPILDRINIAIPQTPLVQEYLRETSSIFSSYNILLYDFIVDYPDKESVTVRIRLLGDVEKLPEVVFALENTSRLSDILEVKAEDNKDISYLMDISVKIYYLDDLIRDPLDFEGSTNAKIDTEFLLKELKPAHE